MTPHPGEIVPCVYLAEFIDEADPATTLTPAGRPFPVGHVVPTQPGGSYVDVWWTEAAVKEFTVLFKDKSTATIRGCSLKHFAPTFPGDGGSYGVVDRAAEGEVLVALFQAPDVIGIFRS